MRKRTFTWVAALGVALPGGARAQAPAADSTAVATLVRQALAANPEVRAAEERLKAARAAVAPAGALPDPMLSAGVTNFSLSQPGFGDFMTMKMVGIGQTLPYPGKLSLRRRAAEWQAAAAEAGLEGARLVVAQQVQDAWYELAFIDRALDIVRRNETLAGTLVRVAEARYTVGTAAQQDALRARVEATRLGEDASALIERRRAVLARLNAALDRPTDTPVENPAVPARLAAAAVAESPHRIRFAAQTLGARAADSPLPDVAVLERMAAESSPELRGRDALITAQAARVELAGKAALPDFGVSISYGQRDGRSDMVSAMVSVPIPIHKGQKQDQELTEARARLSALEAERRSGVNEINARIAELVSAIERDRAQLALLKAAVIPQARATLTSLTASYQVGKVDFSAVLDNQATVFNAETEYFRLLSDFARNVAQLERTVGGEVIP